MQRLEQIHLSGYKELGDDVVFQMTKEEAEALKMALEFVPVIDEFYMKWARLWTVMDHSGIDSV